MASLVDAGLVLYVGLIILFTWRCAFGWRLCGRWLGFANYCVLLYALLLVLLIYAVFTYVMQGMTELGKAVWGDLVYWLRPIMLGAPVAACLTFVLCCIQTMQHVEEIRNGASTMKHDRAVLIVALPVVYGTMSMAGLMRLYVLISSPGASSLSDSDRREQLALAKNQTCLWVGDLYEAWALYQFGKLTLELVAREVRKRAGVEVKDARTAAKVLVLSHTAIESLASLGVTMFLVVCVIQAGWSLYLLTVQTDWEAETYTSTMKYFGAAGMLASGGAIYNVHIVESVFSFLTGYNPLLKFVTVKILVSFAFFQRGIFHCLQVLDTTLPEFMQKVTKKVPVIGDVLTFNPVQFELFYSSLILYECFTVALINLCAWSAFEFWYHEDADVEQEDDSSPDTAEREKLPLLGINCSTNPFTV